MSSENSALGAEYVDLTTELVSAYVGNNNVQATDLPRLIESVYGALRNLGASAPPTSAEKLTPPVPVKKSVTPDYLISLEDGRRYKSLKRHLAGHGLTPAEYRMKWGLAHDYPMVAPSYAKHRSELAKASGLGRKRDVPVGKPSRAGRRAG